ncbi:polyketide cyclase [Herbaspirillum sp. HC18]|nr:polyketide cyclase [Herbaspirillum sp. HC18]
MTTFSTSRQFATEPSAVFAAIKDAKRLARWWGPDGFSNSFEIFEFQTGGKWIFTMIGPDGKTYPNESVFSSIEIDRKVVIQHASQPHFQLTITLEPSSGGTLLRWDQAFADASVAQAVRHIVEPANEQNLDRLSIELGLSDASAPKGR